MAAARASPFFISICICSAAANSVGLRASQRLEVLFFLALQHRLAFVLEEDGHVITASLFAVVRVSWYFCPCCPPVSLFRGPATRRSARKSSHRRAHLFAAELERAVDARAYLDSRRQAAQLFRNNRVR